MSPRCEAMLPKLSAYADGELSAEERAEVLDHLEGCDDCRRFGAGFDALLTLLHDDAARPDARPDDFGEKLRATLAKLR